MNDFRPCFPSLNSRLQSTCVERHRAFTEAIWQIGEKVGRNLQSKAMVRVQARRKGFFSAFQCRFCFALAMSRSTLLVFVAAVAMFSVKWLEMPEVPATIRLNQTLSTELTDRGRLCNGSRHDTEGWWTPLAPGSSPRLLPMQDLWHNCGLGQPIFGSYVRRSGCHILEPEDALISLGRRNLHFMGDSVTRELFDSIRWVRRRVLLYEAFYGREGFSLLSAITSLKCSLGWEFRYETNNWALDALRVWLGWERRVEDHELHCGMAYMPMCNTCGSKPFTEAIEKFTFEPKDILLMNIGAWYNANQTGSSLGDFVQLLSTLTVPHSPSLKGMDRVHWMRQQLHAWGFVASPCEQKPPARRLMERPPRVQCRKGGAATEVEYAFSLISLAEALLQEKQLPKHLVWIDTTPIHQPKGFYFKGMTCGPFEGNASLPQFYWRNLVAKSILPIILPQVQFLHTHEVLREWGNFHWGPQDCVHFCQESQGWNEHVRNILTALTYVVGFRSPSHLGSRLTEDPAVRTIDRFSSCGRMTLYGGIALCALPLVLVLGALCMCICQRKRENQDQAEGRLRGRWVKKGFSDPRWHL
ncbi:unnamed protein product [Durusdinium trenchii]|uniref:Uncharacterized protein n=1 Tax=Durusdinium trenchii TaxID=1381693 RepID=A0ABP0NUI0_9DINO